MPPFQKYGCRSVGHAESIYTRICAADAPSVLMLVSRVHNWTWKIVSQKRATLHVMDCCSRRIYVPLPFHSSLFILAESPPSRGCDSTGSLSDAAHSRCAYATDSAKSLYLTGLGPYCWCQETESVELSRTNTGIYMVSRLQRLLCVSGPINGWNEWAESYIT